MGSSMSVVVEHRRQLVATVRARGEKTIREVHASTQVACIECQTRFSQARNISKEVRSVDTDERATGVVITKIEQMRNSFRDPNLAMAVNFVVDLLSVLSERAERVEHLCQHRPTNAFFWVAFQLHLQILSHGRGDGQFRMQIVLRFGDILHNVVDLTKAIHLRIQKLDVVVSPVDEGDTSVVIVNPAIVAADLYQPRIQIHIGRLDKLTRETHPAHLFVPAILKASALVRLAVHVAGIHDLV